MAVATPTTQISLSTTILRRKVLELPAEIADSRANAGEIQDKPGPSCWAGV